MECKSLFLKRKDYLRDLEEYLMDEEDEELADHFQSLISSKKNEKKLYKKLNFYIYNYYYYYY